MPYTNFPQVSDIIEGVSTDIRNQMSGNDAVQNQILIDYTNRISKQILRFSRWTFLLSEPLYFLTEKGQTNYWIGPTGAAPAGYVDTGLNLLDVDKIKKDSVIDISNTRALKWMSAQPWGIWLNDTTGRGRTQPPTSWVQNPNEPKQLNIFPPSDNNNPKQPFPQVPITLVAAGGALSARTYFTLVTYVDTKGGESTAPPNGREQYIGANNLITVRSPEPVFGAASSGVLYSRYNVYSGVSSSVSSTNQPLQPASLTLQNVTPIDVGTDWTEPTSGLTTSGVAVPTQNTLEQFGAYLLTLQYYKARITLTQDEDFLQVPEDYKDVVIAGVTALVFRLLGKNQEASQAWQMYRAGLTEMIWDKNLFPEGQEFMRPDRATFVNQQILGYLPPNF